MSTRTAEELIEALEWRGLGGDTIDGEAADWMREHQEREKRLNRVESAAQYLYGAVLWHERGDDLPGWLRVEVERAKSFVEHQLDPDALDCGPS